jgi:hypothetical protein
MHGTLGANNRWPGRAVWSNPLPAGTKWPDGIGADDGRAWHLTEFEDGSSPRPGTDEVFFAPAEDQSALERPPIVHTTVVRTEWPGVWGGVVLTVGLPVLAVVCGATVVRLVRRRRG